MGQARLRGSFEERRNEAIHRENLKAVQDDIKRKQKEAEQKKWDLAHPKQARARKMNTILIASALSMAMPTAAFEIKDY